MATSSDTPAPLPPGVWSVDPESSQLRFDARAMLGLVHAHGHFGQFTGTLSVDEEGARGELTIQAGTLDTHNVKRDRHLRSADFFDVESHPTLSFELSDVKAGAHGELLASGILRIRDNALAIEAPVLAENPRAGRLVLDSSLNVSRAAAGLDWDKRFIIKDEVRLSAKLTLLKQD